MHRSIQRIVSFLLIAGAPFLIQAAYAQAPMLSGPTSATYAVGINYGLASASPIIFTAFGEPTPAISESGTLPAGVSFTQLIAPLPPNESGVVLVGTPAAGSEGTYNLTLTATNGVSPDATLAFTLTIDHGTVPITSGFTGNWFDPAQSGHGFSIEVLPGNQMLAEWYVFAPNGGQSWIAATGPITGNIAVLQGFQPAGSGGRFPPNFDPSNLQNQVWGTITFTFSDCNTGTASWQPTASGYASGSIPISRLTMPAGLTCP